MRVVGGGLGPDNRPDGLETLDIRPDWACDLSTTLQTFRELVGRRPFEPFRLVMSSGQTYDVRHPEMAWLTRTSILVGLEGSQDHVPAEFKICSMLHVTAIEPLNIATETR